MNLRSKRLSKGLDPTVAAFLDSTKEDAALVRDDILGSIAHVASLEKARLLSRADADRLRSALVELMSQSGTFELKSDLEDVHMNVEAWLTERVGDLGKKVHTGRSRNDQVALDLRLWARRQALLFAEALLGLSTALASQARANPEAILPGHTHFQIAQPVLWSHQLGAHMARIERDLSRVHDALARINISPLGAGALAGSPHSVDPEHVAKLLAFDAAFDNSLDAVSDRDPLHELLFVQALALTHASGLAEELILYSHPAFGFVALDDAHTTGSSLMPQKKNPDALEVARAKAATAVGALTASLGQARALPLAYNRDLQETKRLALEQFPAATATIQAVAACVKGLRINAAAMLKHAAAGHSDATDLADYLVSKDVPFRTAHEEAAACVRLALDAGCMLSDLPLAKFQSINAKIGKDVKTVLGPRASVTARTSRGGTGPQAAEDALVRVAERLDAQRASFAAFASRIQAAESSLLANVKVVKTK